MPEIKLNLGSHNKDVGKEYINVDVLDLPNVDLICDLNIVPFKFKIRNPEKFKNNEESWDFLFDNHFRGETTFRLEDFFVDEVLMEETLEHISFRRVPAVLKEIYRILKLNGKLRLQVPDCGAAMRAWVEGKVCNCVPHKAFVDGTFKANKGCLKCKGEAIMDWERWLFSFTGAQKHQYDSHLSIFTKQILEEELRKSGFTGYKFIDNQVKLKVEAIK